MLWLFSKGPARLRVTTSRDASSGDWVVELERPDCIPETYRFSDQQRCEAYLSALESELDADNWVADGVRITGRPADAPPAN